MGEYSAVHLALFSVLVFLWVFPLWRIIGKAGYHPAISVFAIVPAFAVILLWWLAFARWPTKRGELVGSRDNSQAIKDPRSFSDQASSRY